jgi:transcriptional regulator with XRE-family HTH domain
MTNESSISTPSTKKTLEMTKSSPQAPVIIASAPEIIVKPQSSHSLTDLYGTPEFSLAWDNDIKHHIARNVLYLRRFRDISQATVADKMGTSQSAVARIEAAEENITIGTLQRLITALKGRFFVSIVPEELSVQRHEPWWKANVAQTSGTTSGWTASFVAFDRTGDRAVIGLQRDTLPSKGLKMLTVSTS